MSVIIIKLFVSVQINNATKGWNTQLDFCPDFLLDFQSKHANCLKVRPSLQILGSQ